MRVLVHDPSRGVGGGQRWSRQLAKWLQERGKDVTFSAERVPPAGPFDVVFDMAPVGDPGLYPTGAEVFLWWHAPRSLRRSDILQRARVLCSSAWSAETFLACHPGRTCDVIHLFTDAVGGCGTDGVLFFGRLTRAKGVYAVLRYARELPTTRVTIAGATWSSPPETLQDMRKAGAILDPTDEEVDRLYAQHKVFWQLAGMDASPPEGFGLAAADALVRGMIVLGYRAGGLVEWLPERFLFSRKEALPELTRQALQGRIEPATPEEVKRIRRGAFERRWEELGLP